MTQYLRRVAAPAFILAAATAAAHAGTPNIAFDYATIVGQGPVIQVDRLPVTTSAGKIVYKDVTIGFTTDGNGGVQLNGAPVVLPSPKLITNHFQPGEYFAQVGNAVAYAYLTSGVDIEGGSTSWTFTIENEPSPFPAPPQAEWQTGAPAPDLAQRIANAKIVVDPDLSYGTNGEQSPGEGQNQPFAQNGLVAAKQISTSLIIWSYTGIYDYDSSTPVGDIAFTKCADRNCSNAPKSQ